VNSKISQKGRKCFGAPHNECSMKRKRLHQQYEQIRDEQRSKLSEKPAVRERVNNQAFGRLSTSGMAYVCISGTQA
jgi:hypothetical protein